MAACTDPKTFSEYLIAYGPIMASATIAFFAVLQWMLARKNFKLSLYQRRFAIYHKVNVYFLDFSVAFLKKKWGAPEFESKAAELASYISESSFLFRRSSGIHALLVDLVNLTNPETLEPEDKIQEIKKMMGLLVFKLKPYLDFTKS